MPNITVIAGWVAGILSFAAYGPYWWSIFKTRNLPIEKRVRPNRATWGVWAFVSIILLGSYWSVGANRTLGVPIVYAVCGLITFLISLKYGEGGWTKFDRYCLAVAAGSALLWWLSGSPLVALLANLGVDLAGAVPTFRKAWVDPASEDHTAWSLFFAGNTANLFALEKWTFVIAIYPAYMFVACGAITLMLYRPREKTNV